MSIGRVPHGSYVFSVAPRQPLAMKSLFDLLTRFPALLPLRPGCFDLWLASPFLTRDSCARCDRYGDPEASIADLYQDRWNEGPTSSIVNHVLEQAWTDYSLEVDANHCHPLKNPFWSCITIWTCIYIYIWFCIHICIYRPYLSYFIHRFQDFSPKVFQGKASSAVHQDLQLEGLPKADPVRLGHHEYLDLAEESQMNCFEVFEKLAPGWWIYMNWRVYIKETSFVGPFEGWQFVERVVKGLT